jgi:GNAT superfamily N-acetyltransferase
MNSLQIEINPTTANESEEFELSEWSNVDEEHWGREIEWVVEDFYFKATDTKSNIVGTLKGKYESGVTYVDNLLIAKNVRGSGVGTELMSFIEDWTKDKGGHKMILFTRSAWKASNFYEKLGYEAEGTLRKHFLGEDFVIYRKFL